MQGLGQFAKAGSACNAWYKAALAGDIAGMQRHVNDCYDQLVDSNLPHAALNFLKYADELEKALQDAQEGCDD